MKGEANPLLHTAFDSVLKKGTEFCPFQIWVPVPTSFFLCSALQDPSPQTSREEQDKLKLTKPVKTTFIPEVPITHGVTKAHRITETPGAHQGLQQTGAPRVSLAHEALSSPTCPLTGYPLNNRVTLDLVFESQKANYMICCLD